MTDTDKIQLYHFERCPFCEKARRGFRALGLSYDSQIIDPGDRSRVEQISGQPSVPVIVDGDTTLPESTDIVTYLDKNYGNGSPLVPESPEERGRVYMLDRYADEVWGPLGYKAIVKVDSDGNDLDKDGQENLQQRINKEAGFLDDALQSGDYLVGDSLTLADLAVSAFISRMVNYSDFQPTDSYTHLWAWYDRIDTHLN